ncbi:MAG: hypothetical protein AB7L66_12660 [Gemmatimonadales bacterium]
MAYEIRAGPADRLLMVVGSGTGSVQENSEIVEALFRQTVVPDPTGVLFDVRRLGYVPSPAEGRAIALTHWRWAAAHHARLAYLAPPGAQYGMARMIEMLAQSHGVEAAVFTTEEEAVLWLLAEEGGSAA